METALISAPMIPKSKTSRPPSELADVVHRHGQSFRRAFPLSALQHRILNLNFPVGPGIRRRISHFSVPQKVRPMSLHRPHFFRPKKWISFVSVLRANWEVQVNAIAHCRTADLGGHVDACDSCGHQGISYNSCRNRHCPKCQSALRHRWLNDRLKDLLPVPYFHVVFTIPDQLGPLALQNPKPLYDLLFKAVGSTLSTIAADPKHLGAHIGFIALLHTWGQNLLLHPHIHCLVPAGGLSNDRTRWVQSPSHFFLPVRVLSRFFRRVFLEQLLDLHSTGKLALHGRLAPFKEPKAFASFVHSLRATDWVVYAKPPFGGPDHVLRYLGRYTHRVAISNHRLTRITDDHVSFRWKDYRDPSHPKIMALHPHEFLRRFLLHALPVSFTRIRHFGFLANRVRVRNIALIRHFLGQQAAPPLTPVFSVNPLTPETSFQRSTAPDHQQDPAPQASVPLRINDPAVPCPRCAVGRITRRLLNPMRLPVFNSS